MLTENAIEAAQRQAMQRDETLQVNDPTHERSTMSHEHHECESALSRIESALIDAQTALAALPDADDVEAEVGQLADDARACHNQAEELLTTDLEDVEGELRQLIAQLSELCTDARSLYNRL